MKRFIFFLTLMVLLPSILIEKRVEGQGTQSVYVAKLLWSPNGNSVAVVERGNERVVIYNSSLQPVSMIGNFPSDYQLRDISWNSDSTQLAIGIEQMNKSGKPIIEVWDVATSTPTQVFSYQDENSADAGSLAIAWRPNSQQIVYSDGEVDKVLNTDTRLVDWILDDPLRRPVYDLVWSFDGNYVAGVDTTGIYIWESNAFTLAYMLIQDRVPVKAAWSPDGLYIATNHRSSVNIWDVDQEVVVDTLISPENISDILSVEWRGKYLVAKAFTTSPPQENVLLVWDISTGQLANAIVVSDTIRDFALHPTEGKLVYGTDNLIPVQVSILPSGWNPTQTISADD